VFISSSEGATFFRLLVIVTSVAIHAVVSCEDGVRAAWHPICHAQHGRHESSSRTMSSTVRTEATTKALVVVAEAVVIVVVVLMS
jgi:hypothetical protein